MIDNAPSNKTPTGASPAWLVGLAAPRWTLLFFLLTALSALAVAYDLTTATALMAAPFALLVANLVASLLTHARFRTDLPLLIFHLALLALVALLVLARLIYLDGRATLTSGTAFDGRLQMLEQGPLHPGRVQDLHFANDGFSEDYYLEGKGRHKATYNRLRWQDEAGRWQAAQIGDDQALRLNGYKIYTAGRRGYSPLFRWQPSAEANAGASHMGTVQLSAQQDGVYAPSTSWTLPGGPEVWVMLDTKAAAQGRSERQSGRRVNLGAVALDHSLVLRIGPQRFVLKPGQSLDLPTGRLTYVRLDTWMGYLISYDPTLPWIMASILIGVGSLIWFYWRRVF
jgi:hypothetical protein